MRDLASLQHQSRAKHSLSALAMLSPLILTCCLCSIASTLYNISEERMTFVDSQEQESTYCDTVLYLHLLNGLCRRGQTINVDVESSCMQWTDSEIWREKDEFNLFMTNNGTAGGYVETELAKEASTMWPLLAYIAEFSIAIAFLNFCLSIIALDTDLLHTRLKLKDPDLVVLVVATIFNLLIIATCGYAVYTPYMNSQMIERNSWTNESCDMTTGPELGAYIYCMGIVFSLMSLFISVGAVLYLYCCVPLWKRRNVVQDQSAAADPRQKARDRHAQWNRRHGPTGGTAHVHRSSDTDAAAERAERGETSGSGTDTDDDGDGGKNLSIRVRGSVAGAQGLGSPSIADSIDGSLKIDSPRSPRPTPPAKPPKPSKVKAAGGGVDREQEAVPYSPPSVTPDGMGTKIPPKKPPKPAKKMAGDTDPAHGKTGDTDPARGKAPPKKPPKPVKRAAPAAAKELIEGGEEEAEEVDRDEEIARLKAALAAAEAGSTAETKAKGKSSRKRLNASGEEV